MNKIGAFYQCQYLTCKIARCEHWGDLDRVY